MGDNAKILVWDVRTNRAHPQGERVCAPTGREDVRTHGGEGVRTNGAHLQAQKKSRGFPRLLLVVSQPVGWNQTCIALATSAA